MDADFWTRPSQGLARTFPCWTRSRREFSMYAYLMIVMYTIMLAISVMHAFGAI